MVATSKDKTGREAQGAAIVATRSTGQTAAVLCQEAIRLRKLKDPRANAFSDIAARLAILVKSLRKSQRDE